MNWTKTLDGYRSGMFDITDHGGHWAVSNYGRWLCNIDTLAEAKAKVMAEIQVQADNDEMEPGGV